MIHMKYYCLGVEHNPICNMVIESFFRTQEDVEVLGIVSNPVEAQPHTYILNPNE